MVTKKEERLLKKIQKKEKYGVSYKITSENKKIQITGWFIYKKDGNDFSQNNKMLSSEDGIDKLKKFVKENK